MHEALSFTAGPPPSDRTLRETVELRVLRELAYALVSPQPTDPTTTAPLDEPDSEPAAPKYGRVIVVGGAVMDATFRTKMIPAHETSGFAHDFQLMPGGKGLWQAVAAAKLGLEVSLVAAIGDDRFGREIIDYLKAENVDTSLLKIVRGARTPFTGVVELDLGDSIALIWRNDQVVKLDTNDVDTNAEEIAACDALLLTFEIPRETTQRTLTLAHADADTGRRPLIIVTSGQPDPNEGISRASLQLIDYFVSHAWELDKYSPPDLLRFNPDRVGEHLLSRGIETLCLLGNGGGTIYSDTAAGTFRLSSVFSLYKESSTARDAFCAALVAKLLENNRTLTQPVARWATAAMAYAAESFGTLNSLPTRPQIEQRLQTLS
ncbi:carbohydrate kinase family protein [Kribbella qitaiheensis]|uniref:Carbohydrate kinase family protein n=1 Tax=Kribbella qitaiheensis TaxID=1544730 RepID=A0A7G6X837_9ACTN|nr:carbohydrate kinase family protein [Kribbella qitaiheensis]